MSIILLLCGKIIGKCTQIVQIYRVRSSKPTKDIAMTILSHDFVFTALQSNEEFPIDFDNVWQPLGYSRKSDALSRLVSTHDKATDYVILRVQPQNTAGRPLQVAKLTVECFKSFCMVAETPEGREVRKYFIEVEKAYRTNLEKQLLSSIAPVESEELAKLKSEYKRVYDKMQYFQARSMAGDFLERIKTQPEQFTEDSHLLWLISGIANEGYFISRCKEDLSYGSEYVTPKRGKLMLTPYAAIKMLLNFRSMRGTAKAYLPERVEVKTKDLIKSTTKGNKINRRASQPD